MLKQDQNACSSQTDASEEVSGIPHQQPKAWLQPHTDSSTAPWARCWWQAHTNLCDAPTPAEQGQAQESMRDSLQL